MAEHIKEMAELQKSLMIKQHQAHMANLERQKAEVRREIEQVAEMLIHGRSTRKTSSSSSPGFTKKLTMSDLHMAGSSTSGSGSGHPSSAVISSRMSPRTVRNLKDMFMKQGKPRMAALVSSKFREIGNEELPSQQAMAWHQRFTDNYRLRQLQHRALRLRGPVLMPQS